MQYIELLEKTLKNEQAITAKAVTKIRALSAENKKIKNKTIDEFAKLLKYEYGSDEVHETIDEIAELMRG